NMSRIREEYAVSVHGTSAVQHDGSFTYQYAGAGASRRECAVCHTKEGFIEKATYGVMEVQDTNGVAVPHHIDCDACHSGLHVSFDVENDGEDFALRTTSPVNVIIDEGNTIDLGGPSNLCVNCHQARTAYPDPDGDGNFNISSTHWGPHHGPQGNLIVGMIGYKFAGSVNYPETGNTATPHAKAGCTTCHMNDADHTFEPSLDACAQCHGDVTDFDINGVQTTVVDLLAQLESKLEEKGVMADGSVVPGTYTVDLARAYYNYILIEEDRSEGAHNPDYIKALLQNTIEAIQ
ncbi:MAG TPA: hypothetical protein VKA27_06535, partial [Sunxiuqinia sp.]|nr:hypothetical protein [Sunxiuqinia sp.]